MNPNSITEINESLSQDIYRTLIELFTWKNAFVPSWFNTWKGVGLAELSIEGIPADKWLERETAGGNAKACYITYLKALQDINIIKFLGPYKEEKAAYVAKTAENEAIIRDNLLKAAESGIRPARLELAKQYRMGGFFEADYSKALPLLESLYEEEADPNLLYQIGIIYFGGNGIKQDLSKAADYLRRSGLDKGVMKVAGGPDMQTICRDYELCCELRVVIGTREIASPVFRGVLSEYHEPTLICRDYPKDPEVIMIPLTPEIFSINPYGYDISPDLLVKGKKVLHTPLTLERLDSMENLTLDNFDKICFSLHKK